MGPTEAASGPASTYLTIGGSNSVVDTGDLRSDDHGSASVHNSLAATIAGHHLTIDSDAASLGSHKLRHEKSGVVGLF